MLNEERPGISNNTQAPLLILDVHSQVGCLKKIYSLWYYFIHSQCSVLWEEALQNQESRTVFKRKLFNSAEFLLDVRLACFTV